MWRVDRETVLLPAGPAALLLHIAHRPVAEGAAAHSRLEADSWLACGVRERTITDRVGYDPHSH